MSSKLYCKLAGALMVALLAATAQANVIYDNGASTDSPGGQYMNLSQYTVADDFSLNTASAISSAQFWDWEFPNTANSTVQWWIYADNSGQPGSIVASGSTTPVSKIEITPGSDFGNEYLYTIDLNTGVLSANTTYWFGLHLASTSINRPDIFWSLSDNPTGYVPQYEDAWAPVSTALVGGAFNLSGVNNAVPDGGSTVMMLGGALALVGFLRRRFLG